MDYVKLAVKGKIRQSICAATKTRERLTYLVTDEEAGDELIALVGKNGVLFDSYATWPSDAPDEVKGIDAFMGPGYWSRGEEADESGDVPSPPRSGDRLLVIAEHLDRCQREATAKKTSVIVEKTDDVSTRLITTMTATTPVKDHAPEASIVIDIKEPPKDIEKELLDGTR